MKTNSIGHAGSWKKLEKVLNNDLINSIIEDFAMEQMSPVQAAVIPVFLQKKDVVVEAVTGSGKTLAFLLPVMQIILEKSEVLRQNQIGAIILSPTRELAQQIFKVLGDLCKKLRPRLGDKTIPTHGLYIGGNSTVAADIRRFEQHGANIIVGTPGRVVELLKHRSIVRTSELEAVVFDEADRLLDMGFFDVLKDFLALVPKQRRTGLFSATMVDGLSDLIRVGLRNPVRVSVKVQSKESSGVVNDQRIPSTLSVYYIICPVKDKLILLNNLLRKPAYANKKGIMYMATCAAVDYFYSIFTRLPFTVLQFRLFSLHGKMDVKKRELVYDKYVAHSGPSLLITTDLASRGLDIPGVDFVVQFDPPQDPKTFAHRCGRTARAGNDGDAVIFLTPVEDTFIEFIKLRKVPLQQFSEPIGLISFGDDEAERWAPILPINDTITSSKDLFQAIRNLNANDLALHNDSLRAYVSYLRYYHEHQLTYIFPFKKLDLLQLAQLYGLLVLPKCPELKEVKKNLAKLDWKDWEGNVNLIPYLNEIREKARQKRSLNPEPSVDHEKRRRVTKNDQWSLNKEAKLRRQARRAKKERKRQAILLQKQDHNDAQSS